MSVRGLQAAATGKIAIAFTIAKAVANQYCETEGS
jgi:hypothetical protein